MAQTEEVRSVQNIFEPTSTPAQLIDNAGMLTLLICLGIFLIVTFLLFFSLWRYRRRGSDDDTLEPPQVYGSTAIELAWTVPPIMIVVVLVLVTARTVGEIQNHQPTGNPIRVRVVGHRFWWEYQYTDQKVTTANELNVPVSYLSAPRPIELTLESADVIHGFWVPELSGKLQAVPNHANNLWLEPSVQGTYLGNCTVLCGQQHANMLLRVIVRSPDEYQRWLENEKKPAQTTPDVEAGRQQFIVSSCGSCHTIKGTDAHGVFGPDLTHFANRETLGSGVAKNDEPNLRAWLQNPQALKPGCLMPNMQLNEAQLKNLLAYLKALK